MKDASTQAKQYGRQKIRLAVFQLLLTLLFLIVMLFSGASVFLKQLVTRCAENFYIQAALYLTLFSIIYYLLFVGLDFYGGFLLERKFSLSTQKITNWLKQSIKKWLLSFVIFLVAAQVLYIFLRHFPNNWPLPATAAWLLFTIVLGKIAPVLIIPLFYKCNPLDNIALKERLLKLSSSCGLAVEQVFQIQLSRQTIKANAAVAGLGAGRRILLADTLLENFTDDQIEAVFAHELGHVRLHHVWKILTFTAVFSMAAFFLTNVLFKISSRIFGFSDVSDIAAFALLALILIIVGLLFVPVQNAFLRYLEKQADIFALAHITNTDSFTSAITKLAHQNLSDPSPSRLVEILFHTHPPISERIDYARQKKNGSALKEQQNSSNC